MPVESTIKEENVVDAKFQPLERTAFEEVVTVLTKLVDVFITFVSVYVPLFEVEP